MEVQRAPDVEKLMTIILKKGLFPYVDKSKIVCMRSTKATSRARARIWSFPKIWQMALDETPHYIIEVLSQYFDKMSDDDKTRVIIHELMHIPKNFSGSLVPHRGIHKKINTHTVEQIFRMFRSDQS